MSQAATLRQAIPVLRIFSVDKAKEFYLDFLGFTLDWEHRIGDNFPLYAQVSRSGIAKDYRYYKPGIEDEPWGRRSRDDSPRSRAS